MQVRAFADKAREHAHTLTAGWAPRGTPLAINGITFTGGNFIEIHASGCEDTGRKYTVCGGETLDPSAFGEMRGGDDADISYVPSDEEIFGDAETPPENPGVHVFTIPMPDAPRHFFQLREVLINE